MGKSAILSIEQHFTPECPVCKRIMHKVPGQKAGAWRCQKCKGEFWNQLQSTVPDISEPTEKLHVLHSDYTPGCPRCRITMKLFKDEAWHCEQCNGQFWANAAPELSTIHDQLICCTTKDIMRPDGGFKMLISAKHKSSGSKNGKSRKKKAAMRKCYYFDDSGTRGKKGA